MNLYRSPETNASGGQTNQLAIPVPATDANQMIADRSKMTLAGQTLSFYSSEIAVSDIIDYYKNASGSYTGIRFYPSLIGTQLYVTMCLSDSERATDSNFFLLDESANTINEAEATSYVNQYWQNVLIDTKAQTATNPLFKKSKFYFWDAFLNYFSINIHGFNIDDSATYAGFTLKIDTGYVSDSMADLYFNTYNIVLYPGLTQMDLVGFTTILSLLDNRNDQLIDPTATYQQGNYFRRYLEMANSCPPKCGSLL